MEVKTGDGDLLLINEPALLTRCACISHEIYHQALPGGGGGGGVHQTQQWLFTLVSKKLYIPQIRAFYLAFSTFITIWPIRTDRKWSGRAIGGRDQERSSSQVSNSGHPLALYDGTLPKAIGTDKTVFDRMNLFYKYLNLLKKTL